MTAVVIRESRATSGNKLPQFDQSTRKKKKKKKKAQFQHAMSESTMQAANPET